MKGHVLLKHCLTEGHVLLEDMSYERTCIEGRYSYCYTFGIFGKNFHGQFIGW